MSKKVLFLVPYSLNTSPSQRFRFELFFPALREANIHFETVSFLNVGELLSVGDSKWSTTVKVILKGFWNRFMTLSKLHYFDFIFIHREATPLGPPWVEWIIRFVFRKRIIYDFDDAIWTTDRVGESPIIRALKWRSKVSSICKWSYKVSAGNEYLMEFAARYNTNVHLIPTVVDTVSVHHPLYKVKENNRIIIGWTGSSSTLKYLKDIVEALQRIEDEFPDVSFLFIADKSPDLPLKRASFLEWNEAAEVVDLSRIDIGIMPLPSNDWAKGKCGFKAIQYMALEIPAVVSPVGVNSKIVEHGINGFLAESMADWIAALSTLVTDPLKRLKMGEMARKKIHREFSLAANRSKFLSLFD